MLAQPSRSPLVLGLFASAAFLVSAGHAQDRLDKVPPSLGDRDTAVDESPSLAYFKNDHDTTPGLGSASSPFMVGQDQVLLLHVCWKKQFESVGDIAQIYFQETESGLAYDIETYEIGDHATANTRMVVYSIPFPTFMELAGRVHVSFTESAIQEQIVVAVVDGIHKQAPVAGTSLEADLNAGTADVNGVFSFPNQYALAVHYADNGLASGVNHTPGLELLDTSAPFGLDHISAQELLSPFPRFVTFSAAEAAASEDSPDWLTSVTWLNPRQRAGDDAKSEPADKVKSPLAGPE